jgi:hypothetical protein
MLFSTIDSAAASACWAGALDRLPALSHLAWSGIAARCYLLFSIEDYKVF